MPKEILLHLKRAKQKLIKKLEKVQEILVKLK
jgi:hypothetical protein